MKRTFKKFISTLFFTFLTFPAFAFDFKGIELGKPSDPSTIYYELRARCSKGVNDYQVCNGDVTIAGVSGVMNLLMDQTGVVIRISINFDSENFDTILPEVLKKFGNGKRSATMVQNKMGAKFENITYTWKKAGGLDLVLTKYAGNLERSNLYFSTPADKALLKNSGKAKANDI